MWKRKIMNLFLVKVCLSCLGDIQDKEWVVCEGDRSLGDTDIQQMWGKSKTESDFQRRRALERVIFKEGRGEKRRLIKGNQEGQKQEKSLEGGN